MNAALIMVSLSLLPPGGASSTFMHLYFVPVTELLGLTGFAQPEVGLKVKFYQPHRLSRCFSWGLIAAMICAIYRHYRLYFKESTTDFTARQSLNQGVGSIATKNENSKKTFRDFCGDNAMRAYPGDHFHPVKRNGQVLSASLRAANPRAESQRNESQVRVCKGMCLAAAACTRFGFS